MLIRFALQPSGMKIRVFLVVLATTFACITAKSRGHFIIMTRWVPFFMSFSDEGVVSCQLKLKNLWQGIRISFGIRKIFAFGIRNTAQGIRNPTNDWNSDPSSTDKESWIQYLVSGIQGVESRITKGLLDSPTWGDLFPVVISSLDYVIPAIFRG